MNKLNLPQLAIKILGLILIVISIPFLPMAICSIILTIATHDESYLMRFTHSLPHIIYFISGCVFLFASKKVSNKLIISEDRQVTPIALESLQNILYSVIGLCLIMFALPQFVNYFSLRVYMKSINATSSHDAFEKARTISTGVQVILGFWLFLGSKGLIGLRDKLRNFGIKDQS